MVNTLANAAAVLRVGMRAPKYPLWCGMAVLTHLARKTIEPAVAPPPPPAAAWWQFWARPAVPVMPVPPEESFPYWPALYVLSVSALLALGYRKVSAKAKAQAAQAAKEAKANGGVQPMVAATEPPMPSCAARAG